MLRQILALIVRVERVFLGIVNDEIGGEIEIGLFAVDLHLLVGERGLEPVGNTFVVGAKNN